MSSTLSTAKKNQKNMNKYKDHHSNTPNPQPPFFAKDQTQGLGTLGKAFTTTQPIIAF
jgi:hypothetical protein